MALDADASRSAERKQTVHRLKRWSALGLGLMIAVAFVVSLTPLQIAGSFDAGVTELVAGLGLRLDDSITVSLVQRSIVYIPLGLLAYATIALRSVRWPFLGTILIIAITGLAIELLQSFLSKRQAFSIDFLLVLIVGMLTALAGEIIAGFLSGRRRALLQLLLLGNIMVLSAIWLAHRGSDLASWECSYPLIIGNEATSDRPWLGKIRGLAIYARALSDADVASIATGFDGASSVDRTRLGAGLVTSFDRGRELEIARPTSIEATRDASALCEAIKDAEAFTIEIEIISRNLDQRGPARILSMSRNPEKRNVTLGQDGSRMSLRIRNELNGDNGIEQQIRTADNVISGGWQHWVAIYDRGITKLFLDGNLLKPSLDYESILLVSGRKSFPLATICGLLSFVLGAAAYAWLHGSIERTPWRMFAVLTAALAPQAAMVLVIVITSQRLPAVSVMGASVVAACVGVLFAWRLGRLPWWFRSGRDPRIRPDGTLAER
ncbi:MAG: LamG-like jellyroll fold domain-containing protein [Geminicoccaceae bacterium]